VAPHPAHVDEHRQLDLVAKDVNRLFFHASFEAGRLSITFKIVQNLFEILQQTKSNAFTCGLEQDKNMNPLQEDDLIGRGPRP
jgi:hypothetical protein